MISRIKLLLVGWKRKLFGPREEAPYRPHWQRTREMPVSSTETVKFRREQPFTPQHVLKSAWDTMSVETDRQIEARRQKPSSAPPAKIPMSPVFVLDLSAAKARPPMADIAHMREVFDRMPGARPMPKPSGQTRVYRSSAVSAPHRSRVSDDDSFTDASSGVLSSLVDSAPALSSSSSSCHSSSYDSSASYSSSCSSDSSSSSFDSGSSSSGGDW